MMLFSKGASYGIRALAYLSRQGQEKPCGLRDIAGSENIPSIYLRKILGELRRHRLLKSLKGIHGGYQLSRAPQAISLWEVLCALDPEACFDQCVLARGDCNPGTACGLHRDWQRIHADIVQVLHRTTIADVAQAGLDCVEGLSHLPNH